MSWILAILAVLLLCLASPNRLLHSHWAALIGLVPLWLVCWERPFWQQLRISFAIWFVFSAFVFLPDLWTVKVLVPAEIIGGIVVAPLIPLFYVGVTLLSLNGTRPCPLWLRPLAMASLWTACDSVLGLIFFPIPFHWGSLLFDWPVGIQIADLTGIWGVTFFAVLINATLTILLQLGRRAVPAFMIGLGVVAAVLGYGVVQLKGYQQGADAATPYYRVGAVQQVAWLETDRSWPYREIQYRRLHHLSRQALAAGADLIVWPEGAVRARLAGTTLEPYLLSPLQDLFPPQGGLLTGSTEPDPRTLEGPEDKVKFINSALLYTPLGQIQDRFGKQWIFPYFESARYVPSPDGYRPLNGGTVLGSLGVMICLESVLPHPSRELVRRGAQSLLVISDDSWFGNSNWPMLHGNLSIFRAIENRRSFLFVNNTGGNLIVDPSGRVQQAGQIFETDVVVGTMKRSNTLTFFNRAGDWFAWLTILASGIVIAYSARGFPPSRYTRSPNPFSPA